MDDLREECGELQSDIALISTEWKVIGKHVFVTVN